MKEAPCRDCGYLLEEDARVTAVLRLNREAVMIDRFIWRRFMPAIGNYRCFGSIEAWKIEINRAIFLFYLLN